LFFYFKEKKDAPGIRKKYLAGGEKKRGGGAASSIAALSKKKRESDEPKISWKRETDFAPGGGKERPISAKGKSRKKGGFFFFFGWGWVGP